MSLRIVVTGTDTEIGKTVFAAGLADLLGANYWKPIQSGLDGETDSEIVARLGGLSSDRIWPERYRLNTPVSPHQSAAIDGVHIDAKELVVPDTSGRPLVIEGAGGLMVPLDPSTLYIDVFARWRIPVVLCARTLLGTINHSLLSIKPCVGAILMCWASPLSVTAIWKANARFARSAVSKGSDGCPGFRR